ncbi:uncharacterized protein FIBRA_02339 [Fibroporia radiculosa]|uniref:Urea carboxylase n=1 Tax=Fibroporia radiculosa TaxID=599839 RepID=J4H1T0_9APHY|nr:uncharacterized protein FIBRA_02339 [Fibroporia radiculosa]CCM00309.1 predicted protein [Fibroporia radiculosa]
MCSAALRLCEHVKYASAGTVEFLVDDATGDFFFLEMNTRLQVEHPVTEAVNPGLDIVELMIHQGIAQRDTNHGGLTPHELQQDPYEVTPNVKLLHSIEARIYCENPAAQFKPSPGVLQKVEFLRADWLRLENWVENGTTITPFFDPLICKMIVTAPTRPEAIHRLHRALEGSQIYGPPNNMSYLRAICESEAFRAGNSTTAFLDTFVYTHRAMDVISGGIETTVQDYPGRRVGSGIPRGGPMDTLAFFIANILVGNSPGIEGLEITLVGCKIHFHTACTVAITGAPLQATINGEVVDMWRCLIVPAGGTLAIGAIKDVGFRAYLAVRGGFPEIPEYLGSKSTSLGLGGYQGRSLIAGDCIALANCAHFADEKERVCPDHLIPQYKSHWIIYCLAGPHCDDEFITSAGIEEFFSVHWKVTSSSNRMGIRLEGPPIAWARKSGGEGGSHPSNIHDNGYAFGTINMNGDTPVILTNDGPDMGGYACVCTVATEEMWKVGQLRPGCTVQFRRITVAQSVSLMSKLDRYFEELSQTLVSPGPSSTRTKHGSLTQTFSDSPQDPKLHIIAPPSYSIRPRVVFRQAGDAAILIEYGGLKLDFTLRARIHAFETELSRRELPGEDLLYILVEIEISLPDSLHDAVFPARKIRFPIVLDDKWNRDALEKYMRSQRDEAVYLPSNIEHLAKNNGLEGGADEALKLLISSDWLVFGVGFYLGCPFLIPIDPRCRLVGQKMNPSRTYTPRGAVGIAGLVAAIYPIESPGGYQLFGRTLPPWQTWGKGYDFSPSQPWLLRPFDQPADAKFTREIELHLSWTSRHAKLRMEEPESESQVSDGLYTNGITSSLSAVIWKIKCQPGDVIRSADDVLVVLEAMKTEINVEAGEEHVGHTVVGSGRGVKEGATVNPGDVLVVLK